MKKKTYMKPAMQVVELRQHQILCGSPYNNVSTPLDIYDDDEEIITDKGSIW